MADAIFHSSSLSTPRLLPSSSYFLSVSPRLLFCTLAPLTPFHLDPFDSPPPVLDIFTNHPSPVVVPREVRYEQRREFEEVVASEIAKYEISLLASFPLSESHSDFQTLGLSSSSLVRPDFPRRENATFLLSSSPLLHSPSLHFLDSLAQPSQSELHYLQILSACPTQPLLILSHR